MSAEIINIETLEELRRFLNEKGIMEVAVRGKKKKFKTFYKISLDKLKQNEEAAEKVQEALNLLKKNTVINEKNIKLLGNIAKLSKLNLVLSGLNLCATCAGFAIMYAKLDSMSSLIADVVEVYKKGQGNQTTFEFKKVVSDHRDMLDGRKTQNYYTKEQMRKLVDDEYNVLDLLINTFREEVSSNREELLFSILSLAEMLSVSLKYFDEVYYFENKERIHTGQYWHLGHDSWIQSYDTLSSPSFMEMIQDFGCFEMGLNTVENDCFYINFYDQVKGFKQDVIDNQEMILAIDDWDLFKTVLDTTNQEIKSEIENAFDSVGLTPNYYQEGLLAALA